MLSKPARAACLELGKALVHVSGPKTLYTLTCRRYIEEEHLDESLRRHLPRDEGKPIEKPAEANLRTKMCAAGPSALASSSPCGWAGFGGRAGATSAYMVDAPNTYQCMSQCTRCSHGVLPSK